MHPKDMFNAVLHRAPAKPGDGCCRTRSGVVLDLVLYKFDSCPYCQIVFRAVRKLGIPLRYRDILKDDEAAETLIKVGGKDQVPCLFVDGKPMYESADIVSFLEREFGPAVG